MLPLPLAAARRGGWGLGWALPFGASGKSFPKADSFRFLSLAALARYDSDLMTQQGSFSSCISLKTKSKSGFSTGSRAGSAMLFFLSAQKSVLLCALWHGSHWPHVAFQSSSWIIRTFLSQGALAPSPSPLLSRHMRPPAWTERCRTHPSAQQVQPG